MADFQTTASATLDKLHEVEKTVREAKNYYQTLKDIMHQASSRCSSEHERILSELNVLQNRVETRHENLERMQAFLKARYDGIDEGLKTADEHMESEFRAVTQRQYELLLNLKELREQTDSKATQTVSAVQTMVQSLSASQDETDDAHDTLVSEWETGTSEQEELGSSLQEKGDSLVGAVENDLTDTISTTAERVSSQIDEKQSEIATYFSSLGEQFTDTLQTTVSSLDENYRVQVETSLDGVNSFTDSIRSAVDQIQTVTQATMMTKDVMTTAVQSTNVGLESAIGALKEIKEIFEKIV